MEPWYKVANPRKEVREGRSFNPDEFAIALEQIVAGTAPKDYKDPKEFFARTCVTRALKENSAMVLRRLAGETANTAPVQTLITQFGGGKTHMLAVLYHLVTSGREAKKYSGVNELLAAANLSEAPEAKVAVFVGNAWDPQPGRETPWIDIAWQVAGEAGIKALGAKAKDAPPGTDAINKVIELAGKPVLLLFDEVLNALTRHKEMAEPFHAFLHNVMRGFVGTNHRAAVISLPRSQVEMTDWDLKWQEKILKVVGAVAKPLIVTDEAEVSEVIRRRLFEDIGPEKVRKGVAKAYADWCFERRAQLPSEVSTVDSSLTETKAKESLRERFEACYPFHPAALSVFQRKWAVLPQYQQTRGTLAMYAQWISWAYKSGYNEARQEPLITLGSAPLDLAEFRSVVLGQLGEVRLAAAIESDIAGRNSHAVALDADAKGQLKNLHRRVATSILFESSGGQTDKMAHLPELRFALGEPGIDTTSIDNAALSLAEKSYFIRKIGTDGFKIGYQPTLKKVVNDRRASLDEESEVKPAIKTLIKREFEKGGGVPLVFFPSEPTEIPDNPRLTMIIMDAESEWTQSGALKEQIKEWMKQRGASPRLYPGAIIWCLKKPGRELKEKTELLLAWKRVEKEIADNTLGGEFDRADKADVHVKASDAEESVKDEIWGSYRYVVFMDKREEDELKVIDLGAGHSSGAESFCGRVLTALKSQGYLNESVGVGYLERNWPPAFKETGAWPLSSLRQSFLSGSLTRLIDPDTILRNKIVEFVSRGDFGLALNLNAAGGFDKVYFNEQVDPADVTFEASVFLVLKAKAKTYKTAPEDPFVLTPPLEPKRGEEEPPQPPSGKGKEPSETGTPAEKTFRVRGEIPQDSWNKFGIKILPKMRAGKNLKIKVDISATLDDRASAGLEGDLKQALEDLGVGDAVKIEKV